MNASEFRLAVIDVVCAVTEREIDDVYAQQSYEFYLYPTRVVADLFISLVFYFGYTIETLHATFTGDNICTARCSYRMLTSGEIIKNIFEKSSTLAF